MAITPSNYSYRQLITGASPSATNTGQVLLIDGNSVAASFWSNVQNGGGDIRICEDAAGTLQLPVEVVSCDNIAQTMQVWTRKPSYTSGDRDIYIFCGTATTDTQPAVTDTFGRNNVWQDWDVVYHSGLLVNSAGTGNDLTAYGSPTTSSTDNFGRSSYDLDGTSQFLGSNFIPSIAASGNDFTLFGWFNPDALGGSSGSFTAGRPLVSMSDISTTGATAYSWALPLEGGEVWFRTNGQNNGGTTATLSTGVWQHVVARYDTTTTFDAFIGNSKENATVTDTSPDSIYTFQIGKQNIGGVQYFDGAVGEVWCSLDLKTDSYVGTTYQNQNNPSIFWTQSTPDDPSGGGGTITVTGATPTYSYTAQTATIDLTGTISVTGQTPSYSYAAVSASIDLTPEITVTGATATYSYSAINGVVELGAVINVTGQTPSYSYSAQNATVTLQGTIEVTGQTPNYSYTAIRAAVQVGKIATNVSFVGTVKAAEFLGALPQLEFSGTIKQQQFSGEIKQAASFIGARK